MEGNNIVALAKTVEELCTHHTKNSDIVARLVEKVTHIEQRMNKVAGDLNTLLEGLIG